MNRYLSLIGKQAGKTTFTKLWSGSEILAALKNGVVTVNPSAQRTLAKGANNTPTHVLVDQEKVHETPRMKELVQFLNRVLDQVENKKDVSEGFLGAVLMVIPEDFHDARWVPLEGVPPDASNKVGFLVVEDAGLDRPAFHLGDGQGRFFGLYSMEHVAKKAVEATRKEIDKTRKARQNVRLLERELAEREATLKRVRKFIRELHLTVVCYARAVRDDGSVVGLDERAQRRLFVEGNALNSKADKAVQLRFDNVSPVSTALHLLRVEPDVFFWMDPDYVEENAKSISKASNKLFTLSALTQAYGWSVANTTKVQRLDAEMYELIAEHRGFAEAYWRKVTEVFGQLWRRPEGTADGEWLEYLAHRRAEQNVAFQAVFLQALGRFGYNLGVLAGWDPTSNHFLQKVEKLSPTMADYRAFRGTVELNETEKKKGWAQKVTDPARQFETLWVGALMKARTQPDEAGGQVIVGYSFNNTRDSVSNTYRALLGLAGVQDASEAPEDDAAEEELTEVEE